MPGYNIEKQSKCKKIGGDHDWNLMDFIRVEQHKCLPGWYVVDDDVGKSFEDSIVPVRGRNFNIFREKYGKMLWL